MTLTDPRAFPFSDRFSTLVQHALGRLKTRAAAPESPEEARARCAFVQEMIGRNPGAFSSDLDVQSMMQHYPGRF